MTQAIPPNAMDQAYVLFSELIAGRWAEAHKELDTRLRGQVGPDAFARAWTKAVSAVGSFERMDGPQGGFAVRNPEVASLMRA